MCDLIKHRGPDDHGYFTDSNVSLGTRRLAIIDLLTGHQPQHNENEDIWIVYNGEIYNFKNLKRDLEKLNHEFYTNSDTEVVLHSYEEWGKKCINKFRGQFAFCIYDSIKEELFLARDNLGLKPLYYYYDGTNFIFASEIKPILCHDIRRIINLSAFSYFLSLGYVPCDLTLFKNINKLPASNYLIFNLEEKKVQLKRYWDISFPIRKNSTISQLTTQLRNLIEESVKIRLISDVPLGAFLSGGIDSSSVVAIMSSLMDKQVKTFSVGFEEGAPVNETTYAKFVADYYNLDHTEIIVDSSSYNILPGLIWHLDDLIADAAIIPVYLLSKYAKDKITVALTGDGADEIFAGYSVFYRNPKFNILNYLPKKSVDLIMKFYNLSPSQRIRMMLGYIDLSRNVEERYYRFILQMHDLEKSKILPYDVEKIKPILKDKLKKVHDIINKFVYWDLKYQLPNQFNMKTDKMSMAASLEARVPFLDQEIVQWASTIPSNLKLKSSIEKYILRMAMKDILPKEILRRKKTGFSVPINLWLNRGFKHSSEDILQRLEKRKSLIKKDYVKRIKRKRQNWHYRIRAWNLIMFELWYETFIEKDDLQPIKI